MVLLQKKQGLQLRNLNKGNVTFSISWEIFSFVTCSGLPSVVAILGGNSGTTVLGGYDGDVVKVSGSFE